MRPGTCPAVNTEQEHSRPAISFSFMQILWQFLTCNRLCSSFSPDFVLQMLQIVIRHQRRWRALMKWGSLEKNGLRLEVDNWGGGKEDKRHKRKTKLNISLKPQLFARTWGAGDRPENLSMRLCCRRDCQTRYEKKKHLSCHSLLLLECFVLARITQVGMGQVPTTSNTMLYFCSCLGTKNERQKNLSCHLFYFTTSENCRSPQQLAESSLRTGEAV